MIHLSLRKKKTAIKLMPFFLLFFLFAALLSYQPKISYAKTQSKKVSITINKKTFSIGDSVNSLIKKLGKPSRIDEGGNDFVNYVYNKDYKNLQIFLIRDQKICGFFSPSKSFKFDGIKYGTKLSVLKKKSGIKQKKYEKKMGIFSYNKDNYSVYAYIDSLIGKSSPCIGILVISAKAEEKLGGYSTYLNDGFSLECFDVTNAFRVNHGLKPFKWSQRASEAARLHSVKMYTFEFLSHTSQNGDTAADRMKAEGINSDIYGENIAWTSRTQNNGFEIAYQWINSSGHRKNMLLKEYTYLGVGSCGGYYTQDFH